MKGKFYDILRGGGLKATKPRVAVLGVFSDDCRPMTAEEIFQKLLHEKIDLATVYRSLKSFEESGIVEIVNLHKDSIYYELSDHHHHHVICKKCGLVERLKECDIDASLKQIQKSVRNFKHITSHSLEFFGICKKCAD
ncbi:MAG: Fur family transcriptional regulator [bacterium]